MTVRGTGPGAFWRGWLVAALVTAGFFFVATNVLDVGESARTLTRIDAGAWATVIGLSLLMAILRALRLVVMARGTEVGPVVKASFLHSAANAILPARIGEAALPLALARYGGYDPVRALGLLLIMRLGDIMALAGIGLVLLAALDIWNHPDSVRLLFAATGILVMAGISAVPAIVDATGKLAPGMFRRFVERITAAGSLLDRNARIALLALTLAIWVTLGIAAQVSISAAGLDIGFAYAWLACIAASLAFALPTNGIASVGPFEAAFVGIVVLSGAPAEAALTAALHLHLCALAGAGLAALSTLVLPARREGRL
ncbi:lysylphosphatidylglycerol synthase transmembrane domain-containing protein [Hoeflea sp.]|uniref:lysylphosphatidylglycerol synthase transmembrane domain-containing protein n=1 Tax=Hoeflea sp. TaxID=1940281 RepID=UPI003B020AC1